ncbi:internal scaffolding protein [Microviridae sp.]|nr:internal scaffolding protein [Microviridae sp.]
MSEIKRPYPRVQTKIIGESKTDQKFKNGCCINAIMKKFNKTGIFPQPTKVMQYADVSEVPTLEDAFKVSSDAAHAFLQLPSSLRKLMNNDPSELENFLSDEKNTDLLVKHGILELKKNTGSGAKVDGKPVENKEKTDELKERSDS